MTAGRVQRARKLQTIYRKGKFNPRVYKHIPWVPEVFLACGGNFRCWPKAEATSGEAASKTSGTERCFLPFPLTFVLFYRITFTPIRLKVSNCDRVGRHVKKCPKTRIILSKTNSSLKFIALRAVMTGSHRSSPQLMQLQFKLQSILQDLDLKITISENF